MPAYLNVQDCSWGTPRASSHVPEKFSLLQQLQKANNHKKEKVQLSSFDSFKLWGLLDNYSNTVQLAPALYIVFHSSRLHQELWPCGRGATWKSKWHCRMKTSAHTVWQLTQLTLSFVTQRCKAAEEDGSYPTGLHQLLSSPLPCWQPSQQMERGIILGRRASEGTHSRLKTTLQVQSKLHEAEKSHTWY